MANLKAGTLIGGNLIWSAGNLPLRVADSNIFINDTQIYTEKYKPTPAAIGAVNKAGDTMTGDLTMRKNAPEIWLHGDSNSANCGKVYFVEGTNRDHGGWMGYNGDENVMKYGYRANGTNATVFQHPYNSNTVTFQGVVLTNASQSSSANSFSRKDYVDSQVATKVALGGSTMTGKLILNYTSSVKVPVGSTSQRGSGVAGDFRFNSDEKGYEGFDGSEWQPIGSGRVAYTRFTANFTAVKGKGHLVDTTKAGIVATLPSGMNEADFVVIGDGAGNASKNPFYIAGYNGDRIVVNADNCMLLFSWVSGKWVITNGIGETGALDTANYLKKAGDTINGDLKFAPGKKIVMPTTDWSTGATIETLPAGDGFGSNLNISSGGNTVLGAGESANNLRSLTNGENLYLTADGNIELISGGNAWADRKSAMISGSGDMSLNRTSTNARFYLGNNSKTYLARSGVNLYLAANEDNAKIYIESKTNPMARVNGTDHEIYHKGNKPTAADIGALPLSGGTLTGTLAITMNDKSISFGTGASDVYIRNSKSNKYLQLKDDATLQYDNKKIYYEGFKPTAADVGAFKADGHTAQVNANPGVAWNARSGVYTSTNTGDTDLIAHFLGAGSCPALQIKARYKNSGLWYRSARDSKGFEEDWTRIYTTKAKPTAADVGALPAVSAKYPITNTAGWHIIGRVRMPQSASTVRIEIVGGNGYNVNQFDQAEITSIVIRSGNNNPKGITARVYTNSAHTSIVQDVAWKNVSGDDYDIYVNARTYGNAGLIYHAYCSPNATVSFTDPAASLGTTKPAGLTDGQVSFMYSSTNKPTAADVGALSASGGTFTGDLISSSRNGGVFGTYDSTKTDQVWSMGTSYRNAADGSNFGNLYGLAYKHTNNATGGYMAGGHQIVMCENGIPKSAIGVHVWSSGRFISAGTGNTFESVGGFLRSNTAQVMSLDGKTYSFVTSPMDAHLCYNSYWDGSTWKKYDNSKTSGYVVVNSVGLRYMQSPAGSSNPNQVAHEIATYHKAVATFYSNWSNYANGYDELSITKNGAMVALAGLVKKHADGADNICTLPEGYRPKARKIFLCGCNGGFIRIDVETNGVVSRGSFGGGDSGSFGGWTSLEAIRFSVL